MFINWRLRELNLKIVYYGPALGGKTTNLQYIHSKTDPRIRSEMVSLKTRGDRTLYFDFLQLELGRVAGLKPRFNLYTVPGQTYYTSTRKLVLQGVDGIVFVADSQAHRLEENRESFWEMRRNLRELGYDPESMPLVLQCNKRDLPNILSVSTIHEHLGLNGVPCLESIAIRGVGVFETLKTIINLVVAKAQQQL
ncbi:MAG TPA: gliding-motility protein MglA [Chloroflexi bacterium]|nr:gliding-motility protein MglA [Chloroflexota bacterium]